MQLQLQAQAHSEGELDCAEPVLKWQSNTPKWQSRKLRQALRKTTLTRTPTTPTTWLCRTSMQLCHGEGQGDELLTALPRNRWSWLPCCRNRLRRRGCMRQSAQLQLQLEQQLQLRQPQQRIPVPVRASTTPGQLTRPNRRPEPDLLTVSRWAWAPA